MGDASAALVVEHPTRIPASRVLADYPAGIGAAVVGHDQIILEKIWRCEETRATIRIVAWRLPADRAFRKSDQTLLEVVGQTLRKIAPELLAMRVPPAARLDPETEFVPTAIFLSEIERRIRTGGLGSTNGAVMVFGWVSIDLSRQPDATSMVVREAAVSVRAALGEAGVFGRIAATRLAVWRERISGAPALELAKQMTTALEAALAGTGRHIAVGLASYPIDSEEPRNLLDLAATALERARLRAAVERSAIVEPARVRHNAVRRHRESN